MHAPYGHRIYAAYRCPGIMGNVVDIETGSRQDALDTIN